MKTDRSIVWFVVLMFFLIIWECEDVLAAYSSSRSRSTPSRYPGVRSGVTRIFRSSRAAVASRYSHGWKTRAPIMGYVYVRPNSTSWWWYTSNYNVDDWSVCFNMLFSGVNNTPVVPIDSHEQLRDINDTAYELAANRLINLTIQHGKYDAIFSNFSGDLELATLSEESELAEKAGESDTWQYAGLFACPMFQSSATDMKENDCCGPEDSEHCCVTDVAFDFNKLYYYIPITVVFCLVLFFMRRDIALWFMQIRAMLRGEPRLPPVGDGSGGQGLQPEQVPLNVAPVSPPGQPGAVGEQGNPVVAPPSYEASKAADNNTYPKHAVA